MHKKSKEMVRMAPPSEKKKFALWLYPETIEKVESLYQQGLITRDEYDQKRKELIDKLKSKIKDISIKYPS